MYRISVLIEATHVNIIMNEQTSGARVASDQRLVYCVWCERNVNVNSIQRERERAGVVRSRHPHNGVRQQSGPAHAVRGGRPPLRGLRGRPPARARTLFLRVL